jgi:hypothetical protein
LKEYSALEGTTKRDEKDIAANALTIKQNQNAAIKARLAFSKELSAIKAKNAANVAALVEKLRDDQHTDEDDHKAVLSTLADDQEADAAKREKMER